MLVAEKREFPPEARWRRLARSGWRALRSMAWRAAGEMLDVFANAFILWLLATEFHLAATFDLPAPTYVQSVGICILVLIGSKP